jgi:hypothetical protein
MVSEVYCGLEHLELTVSLCPVKCCYRRGNGQCGFQELSDDGVDVQTIAAIKGEKTFKVRTAATAATKNIKLGLAIDRYAEYIRQSFPRHIEKNSQVVDFPPIKVGETVNEKDSHVSVVLSTVFGLAPNQQKKFWSPKRFTKWAQRTGSTFKLNDVRESLASIKL